MPNKALKNKSISIRVSQEDYEKIEKIADRVDRTISDTIRKMIISLIDREEWLNELF